MDKALKHVKHFLAHDSNSNTYISDIRRWKIPVSEDTFLDLIQLQLEEIPEPPIQYPSRFLLFSEKGDFLCELSSDDCGWPYQVFNDDVGIKELTNEQNLNQQFNTATYRIETEMRKSDGEQSQSNQESNQSQENRLQESQ